MTLRLFLVSMVAGLGLNLPTKESVTTWAATARSEVTAWLAARDAEMPAGPDAFVGAVDSVLAARPAASAQVPAAPEVPVQARLADLPGAIDDRPSACLTGLDLLAGLTIPEVIDLPGPPAPTPPVVVHPAATDPDAAFDVALGAVLRDFSDDLAAHRPAPTAAVATAAPAFEPMEIGEDLYPGVAYALNRQAERPAPGDLTAPVAVPKGVAFLAPVALADGLYPALATVLNHQAGTESWISIPAANEVVATPTAGARLGRAFRLTREAVYAWANLLNGPAVVTISK